MKSTALLLLLILPILTAGCNAIGGTGAPVSNAAADANSNRIVGLEARMIGLTEELDRVARRLAALESSLGHSPTARETEAPPPQVPDPIEEEIEPENRAEDAVVMDEPPPEAPTETPPAPEIEKPGPIDNWPVPVKSGPWTSILIDAREIRKGALPGTSHAKWRVLDPDGISIFTSADVDPQVLRTRPLFWTAKVGTTLGPAAIPVLGEKPFTLEAVDGALLPTDSQSEALIYVSVGDAAKLRGMTLLGKLVRTGSIAILLRPDGE